MIKSFGIKSGTRRTTLSQDLQAIPEKAETEVLTMRTRKQELGSRNIVGKAVEERRKALNMKQKDLLTQLQIKGIEINSSGLSKIEGQLRSVNDYELKALSEILNISVNELLGIGK